uniref:Uncharacterized protein n=1 Tax=Panagrolaimus davidi TaxID=227884 RepID=A0A914R007_9BILA
MVGSNSSSNKNIQNAQTLIEEGNKYDCRSALEIDGKCAKGSNSSSLATNKNIQTTRTLNEEGNECVKASKFNDAIEKYNQAIELSRKPSYFRNRAAVLQQYNLAIQVCFASLCLNIIINLF